jgi:phosphonate transport system ATP-binding protein
MLNFDSVAMRYADGTRALDGVSLQVPAGQFCVVLGSSGAGKSTLLRMANGLVKPTQGAVQVEGVPIVAAALARVRPRIGMIHQQFNLVLRSTVAENVLAGALPAMPTWRALLGLFTDAQRSKACALIESVGLQEQHLLRRVSELSGGQQQRVGIARAFMLDPPLVLADEPVASLDPQTSHDVLSLCGARRASAAPRCCAACTRSSWPANSPTASWRCAMARWCSTGRLKPSTPRSSMRSTAGPQPPHNPRPL